MRAEWLGNSYGSELPYGNILPLCVKRVKSANPFHRKK